MLSTVMLSLLFVMPQVSGAQTTTGATAMSMDSTTMNSTISTSSGSTITANNSSGTTTTGSSMNMHNMHSGSSTKIMVMKHLCNPSIRNMSDFEALETGRGPIASLANTVLNCPTTGLAGDMPVAGTVASPRDMFAFTVSGGGVASKTLANAVYEPHKVCESDVNLDVDGNGSTSATTCLDISHYAYTLASTTNNQYVVTETMTPANRRFGALRFTPTELAPNNDRMSLQSIDVANGRIYLNTTGDTDRMVMLHIYNFLNATSTATSTTGGGTGTTTTGGGHHDDDDEEDRSCHGHAMNGNVIWMTAGDNHGHDSDGNDVQTTHCYHTHGTGMHMDAQVEKIQKLQLRILKIQQQIIKLLNELIAVRQH